MGVNAKGGASCPSQWIYQRLYFTVSTISLFLVVGLSSALSFALFVQSFFNIFFWCRELARGLGEKGVIVFSDFEHVILKGMPIFLFYYIAFF